MSKIDALSLMTEKQANTKHETGLENGLRSRNKQNRKKMGKD